MEPVGAEASGLAPAPAAILRRKLCAKASAEGSLLPQVGGDGWGGQAYRQGIMVDICICVYISVYIYTHTHLYTYIYIHIYVYNRRKA